MTQPVTVTNESGTGILEAMWRFRWMSAAIIVVMVLVSVGAGLLVAPRAAASATIALATPPASSVLAPGIQGDASLGRYTAQRAGFVTSDAVLEALAAKLGRDDITTLRRDISASPSATSNTIVITANADTGPEAVKLAGAAVDAYRSETAKDVTSLTENAVDSINKSAAGIKDANTLSQLNIQASEIRTSSALFGDGVEFVIAPRDDAVTLPSIPIREAGLGFVLGLVLAATASWIRADRERT
jgi:polysaccharide biosynthesis transport protein